MKKSFKIISAAILSATMTFGLGATIFATTTRNVEQVHADVGTYYSTITDSMSGTTLLNALNTLNNSKRTRTVGYDGMKTFSAVCDADPDGSGKIIGFYDNAKLGPSWDSAATWNREHVWPNARGGNSVEGDAHMVRPASVKTNSGRGSKGFGVDSFDPGNSVAYYRGVASRIIFYCAIANKNLKIEDIVLNSDGSSPSNTMGTLSDMLRWNLQYLPTDTSFTGANDLARRTELSRNEKIQTASNGQGNRNPFIDHPEYACKIWGDTNATTRQICGGSSTSTDPYASISGTTTVIVGNETTLTASLSNVSNASNITWASSNTSVATVEKGTTSTSSSVATVTGVAAGSATIYCKYSNTTIGQATITVTASGGTIIEGDSETIDLTAQGFSDQDEVTSVNGSLCSVLFAKSSGNNPPKYYDNGSSVRTYGGNTFTVSSSTKTIVKIELTFGSSDGSNTITTNPATYSNGTWTGSASSVTFTVGGTSGNRRIQSIKVTYQGSGSSTTPTVNSVTVSPSTLSLDLNGTKTASLTAAVNVSNGAAQTVNWSSSNTSVATVSGGTVTAKAVGTATITATSTVDSSKKGTCTVTVTDSSVSSSVTYNLVTNGLNAGDKVVIVAQANRTSTSGYAMKDTIISDYYFDKVNATISNQKLNYTSDMTIWTVGGSSSTGYTFYSENSSQYFYGYGRVENSKTYRNLGLYESAGSGTSWTVEENAAGTGYDVHTTYNSIDIYLEYYTSKNDFSGYYKSATDVVINFYKETTLETNPAKEYAQNFLAAFTCDATGTNAPTFTTTWAQLKTAFQALATPHQNTLTNATANESGTDIEKAVARYDYVVAKYSYEDFMNRNPGNGSNKMNVFKGTSTNNILLILGSISLLGGLTYLAYFLKKRKED